MIREMPGVTGTRRGREAPLPPNLARNEAKHQVTGPSS